MTHGSLFSGIGGFDLAAQWMGWTNVFHCEYNDFGKTVLKHYWPDAISYTDIKETDFTIHRGHIDILTGGFPCQPYSAAGKRKGKEDDRHLWPEMLRAIREVQPRWVVGENVPGLITWSDGLVFEEVQADLESEGYEVQPVILPACAVNAPHRRDRVWFVAYSDVQRNNQNERAEKNNLARKKPSNTQQARNKRTGEVDRFTNEWSTTNTDDLLHKGGLDTGGHREEATASQGINEQQRTSPHRERIWVESGSSSTATTNPDSQRLQRRKVRSESKKRTRSNDKQFKGCNQIPRQNWEKFPTQSPICSGDDGLSARLDGITFSKWRQESIKAAGNAIVPQVAYELFQTIQSYEDLSSKA